MSLQSQICNELLQNITGLYYESKACMHTSLLSCSVITVSACLPSGSCLLSISSTCFTSSMLFCSCSARGIMLLLSELMSCCCFGGCSVTSCLASCLFSQLGITKWLLLVMSCSARRDTSASRIGGVWSGRRNCCTRSLLSLFGCRTENKQKI